MDWSWLTDIWGDLTDGEGFEIEDIIAILGGIGSAEGWFDSDQEKVGYQGKIPEYTAVRDPVPMDWDSGRRPGQNGQQYFSDTTYAQKPDTPIPTVGEAQATTDAQIAQLIQRNSDKSGFAAGGIVGALPPQAQPQGGLVEAMKALRGGGMPQRPPMPLQGIAQAGRYLNGPTDGMADRVNIDASDGEFVVSADDVSHLGNGNSEAGAAQLKAMMERIRKARTGSKEQGKRINPNNFLIA